MCVKKFLLFFILFFFVEKTSALECNAFYNFFIKSCRENSPNNNPKLINYNATKSKTESNFFKIKLSSNIETFFETDIFKIFFYSSEKLQSLDKSAFIVDGAEIKEIRKLSGKDFMLLVLPNENVNSISIQAEAEKIKSIDEKFNPEASNEIILKRSGVRVSGQTNKNNLNSTTSTSTTSDLSSLLDNILRTNNLSTTSLVSNSAGSVSAVPANLQPVSSGGGSGGSGGSSGGGLGSLSGGSNSSTGGSGTGSGTSSGGNSSTGNVTKEKPDLEPLNKGVQGGNNSVNVPANIPEMCKKNYGFIITGECSTKDLTGKVPQKVANAGMAYCAKVGKPFTVTSLHRTPECNRQVGGVPNSKHLTGNGIDVPPGSDFGQYLFQHGFQKLDEGNHWHMY